MPVLTTLNTTTSSTPPTAWNKEFYDRKLLERAVTKTIYAQFAQKRNIPKNNGKTVEFRRYSPFDVSTTKLELTEGVTPSSQAIKQTTVNATVKQYGAYVETSDLLVLTAYDPVQSDAADLLGEQMGTLVDWLNRDEMISGASAQYAGGALSKNAIATTSKFTLEEARKAVTTLRKAKARPFTDGGEHFKCILSPDQAYDLQSDSTWKEIAVHVDPSRSISGEIGRAYGVAFYLSTEAKVDKQSVLNAVNANTSSSTSFVLKNDPSDAAVEYLSTPGNKIMIGTTEYTLAATSPYASATKTVTLSAAASLSADAIVYSTDCGHIDSSTKAGSDLHHALIFGADAYGNIDIAGSGAIKMITKPAGSAGTADPLDQRSTIGAKILAYTVKVLNSAWLIDIMTSVS